MALRAPKGEEFEKAPPGSHVGICYRVIDLGTQKTTFNGEQKLQHKIMLAFELINETMKDGRPFMVSSRYTFSGFKNALLRKHMESWRAKAYTDDEFAEFDITKCLGVPAMLTLTQSDDEKFVNITGISKLPKGTPIKDLVNEPLALELTSEGFRPDVLNKLHEKLQDTIKASPEYQDIKAGKSVQGAALHEELDGDEMPF